MTTVQPQVIQHSRLQESSEYPAPYCTGIGHLRAQFSRPEGFRQWILSAHLDRGTQLAWDAAHGDEAVYVVDGELDTDGSVCGAGGAVVVESGATPIVRALADTQVIHVGADPLDEPRRFGMLSDPGRGVHVVDERGLEVTLADGSSPSRVAYFATGKCPSCRLMLYRVGGDGDTRSHVHTQPQLQHVLSGTIQVGQFTLGPDTTFAVPAGYRYGYRASGPWELLVHRPDLSMMRHRSDEALFDEAPVLVGSLQWAPAPGMEAGTQTAADPTTPNRP
jgi:hypothetical protein